MRIDLNGTPIEVAAANLADALVALGYGGALATALNGGFIPAAARATTPLHDGDRVEVLAPMQGAEMQLYDVAGPLSQWLHRGLSEAGQPVVLMETRQVKGALKAMPIKTDRRDAEGIERLLHLGWFRPVHCKSVSAQEVRAVLSARKAVQQGFITLEMSLRGLLRNFGLKVGTISRGRFEQRIRELAAGNPMLEAATEPMLSARSALRRELAGLERHVRQLAQKDPVCRQLMSMPGISAVVALTYRSAVDDPARFTSSKKVGPWVGLTPSRNQSGERDISGGITKAGDVNLRRALRQAATVMMHPGRATWLRAWAAKIARQRGVKRAMVALARRIAVILHHMWKDDTDFRFDIPVLHAGASCRLKIRFPDCCPPNRGPSRSPRDAVPVMPCSGLMPIVSSTPMRWADRNCIEPASCWRPQR